MLYQLHNSFQTLHDLGIPKSQHLKSLLFEPFISFIIFLPLKSMLTAIELNDELSLKGHKINYVAANGLLASELEFSDLSVSEF